MKYHMGITVFGILSNFCVMYISSKSYSTCGKCFKNQEWFKFPKFSKSVFLSFLFCIKFLKIITFWPFTWRFHPKMKKFYVISSLVWLRQTSNYLSSHANGFNSWALWQMSDTANYLCWKFQVLYLKNVPVKTQTKRKQ